MTTGRINQITIDYSHRPSKWTTNITFQVISCDHDDEKNQFLRHEAAYPLCQVFNTISPPAVRHTNDASTQINAAKAQTDGQLRVILSTHAPMALFDRPKPRRRCNDDTRFGLTYLRLTQTIVEISRFWPSLVVPAAKSHSTSQSPLLLLPTNLAQLLIWSRDFRYVSWAWSIFNTFRISIPSYGRRAGPKC